MWAYFPSPSVYCDVLVPLFQVCDHFVITFPFPGFLGQYYFNMFALLHINIKTNVTLLFNNNLIYECLCILPSYCQIVQCEICTFSAKAWNNFIKPEIGCTHTWPVCWTILPVSCSMSVWTSRAMCNLHNMYLCPTLLAVCCISEYWVWQYSCDV